MSGKERKVLTEQPWSISAIVLWEISKLAQLGRIEVDIEDVQFNRAIARIHTWPLTFEICRSISKLDFNSDPADELIAATSLVHNVPLITRDKKILKSKSTPIYRF